MEYEGPPIKVHPIQAARVESVPEAKYIPISGGVEVQAAAESKAHFRRTHCGGRGPESNLWGPERPDPAKVQGSVPRKTEAFGPSNKSTRGKEPWGPMSMLPG